MHHALSIKYYTIAIFALFALASCGGRKGELRIKGEIKGLNNADLTIYSRDGVIQGIDTLKVRNGKIDWSCPYSKEMGSLTIVYPTYSTLTVFGSSGDVIEIKGNAQQLSATKVEGNAENEAYTLLREQMENADLVAKDTIKRNFIQANPESPVTRFLQLEELSQQTPLPLRLGEALPDFSLVTRSGDTLTTDSLKGKYSLLVFWSNWRGGTSTINIRIRRLIRQAKQPLECISYNLDVNKSIVDYIQRTDSMTWHTYCDQKVFQSDLSSRLGIRDIPYFILTDTSTHIIAGGTDWQEDIAPHLDVITTDDKSKEEDSKKKK